MELGNIIYTHRSDMPQLEVHSTWRNENGVEETRTYYLTGFRGYRFQVSGTKDGQGDYGSSDVLGLGNILLATLQLERPESKSSIFASNSAYYNGSAAKAIYRSLALNALYEFARMEQKPYSPSFEDNDKLWWFIDEVYKYISNMVLVEQAKDAKQQEEQEEKSLIEKGTDLAKELSNEINNNVAKIKQYTGKIKLPTFKKEK